MTDLMSDLRPTGVPTDRQATAMEALLRTLESRGYRFVTPTPATHARILTRRDRARTIEDVLGWSLPFERGTIDADIEQLLDAAGMVEETRDGDLQACIRVSSLRGRLYLHSAYPTVEENSVFLGPDSYRFADLISAELTGKPTPAGSVIADIGTGSGVGAIVGADHVPNARVIMTDLNERALALARINASHAGKDIEARHGRDLAGYDGTLDLAFANPPYIIDPSRRAYRDGGGKYGAEVSIAMSRAALASLKPGGRFILYTGSAIVAGADGLRSELEGLAASSNASLRYYEIDPDVFGEELDNPGYADVDRIAVIAAIFTKAQAA